MEINDSHYFISRGPRALHTDAMTTGVCRDMQELLLASFKRRQIRQDWQALVANRPGVTLAGQDRAQLRTPKDGVVLFAVAVVAAVVWVLGGQISNT